MQTPAEGEQLSEIYSPEFFEQHRALIPAYQHLAGLVRILAGDEWPLSVVDVGCGHGLLVESLRGQGFDAMGVDGSASAAPMWPDAHKARYSVADLSLASSEIPATDVVTSFETAEHLAEQHAATFASTLVKHQPKYLVFSAATTFQDQGQNATHVNENSYSFWVAQLAALGYGLDIVSTICLRNAMFERFDIYQQAWWYPKNTLVFIPAGSRTRLQMSQLPRDANNNVHLRWFNPIPDNPVLNLIFERDKYEYLYLVERYLRAT